MTDRKLIVSVTPGVPDVPMKDDTDARPGTLTPRDRRAVFWPVAAISRPIIKP